MPAHLDDIGPALVPAAAGLLTAVLIVMLRPFLVRYALARPNARSLHTAPTPQGGVPQPSPNGEKPKDIKGVYIVDASRKVKFVEVTTGITGESDIEVTSGLSPGTEIITGPSRVLKALKEGQTVKRQTNKPGANANANGS